MEERIAADDGVRLWVRQAGLVTAEVTVICCHGGPGVADYLEPVEAALADHVRVIRWDQRGSGRSDPDGPFTIGRFVADLDRVRSWAGVERFVVLGHSWGANLAMHYGQRHPARLDGMVYVSGIGLEWWPTFTAGHKRRQVERLGPTAGGRLRQLASMQRSPAEETEFRMLYIRSELHDTTDEALAAQLLDGERRYPLNVETNGTINAECKDLALDAQVVRIELLDCPVLIIHGASDPRPVAALDS